MAPALVVAFLVLYYVGIAVFFTVTPELPGWAKVLAGLATLALSAVAVGVLVQRIREIRSGEEDDLDQY